MVVFFNKSLECKNQLIFSSYALVFVHIFKVTQTILQHFEHGAHFLSFEGFVNVFFLLPHQFMLIFQDFDEWYSLQ